MNRLINIQPNWFVVVLVILLFGIGIVCWIEFEARAATPEDTREMHEQTVQLRRIADALEVLAGKRR